MASALLTTVLLAQLVSPTGRDDLVAAAAASPRPAACSVAARGPRAQRGTLWTRAKTPGLQGYCAALARGYARLRRESAGALKAAQAAATGIAATSNFFLNNLLTYRDKRLRVPGAVLSG